MCGATTGRSRTPLLCRPVLQTLELSGVLWGRREKTRAAVSGAGLASGGLELRRQQKVWWTDWRAVLRHGHVEPLRCELCVRGMNAGAAQVLDAKYCVVAGRQCRTAGVSAVGSWDERMRSAVARIVDATWDSSLPWRSRRPPHPPVPTRSQMKPPTAGFASRGVALVGEETDRDLH